MATSNGTEPISLIAGESLASKQFLLCKLSAARTVIGLAAATDRPYGVIQDEAASGGATGIQRYGVSKVVAGVAISAGDRLYPLSTGKVTNVPFAGAYCVGKALDAASGDGAYISAELDLSPVAVAPVPFQFRVILATADNANVAKFVPGFVGRFVSIESTVETPTSDTTGKQAVLSLDIAGANVTGGVVTIDTDVTAADPDTLGKRIAGTAITAANTFGATDEVTIEAANITPFTSGVVTVTVLAIPA